MRVYHLVAQTNLDADGFIRIPLEVRHGTIAHGQVVALAGPIDPLTHLNLDYSAHRLVECVVVTTLAVNAHVVADERGFAIAYPRASALQRRGTVDFAARRLAWQTNVRLHHD
ncbi:MAG: hypothetical protein NVS4B8_22040 [Herpetosiphon sp.]